MKNMRTILRTTTFLLATVLVLMTVLNVSVFASSPELLRHTQEVSDLKNEAFSFVEENSFKLSTTGNQVISDGNRIYLPSYDSNKEFEIQKAYCKQKAIKKISDYQTQGVQFLGQYKDSYAVHVLDTQVRGNTGAHFVGRHEFRYLNGRQIYIYNQRNFYTLEEALDEKLITEYDLALIHNEFVKQNSSSYKYIFEDVSPEEEMILGRLSVKIQPQYNNKEYTIEDFSDIGCNKFIISDRRGEQNEIYRHFVLLFDADTREETIAACRVLEEREDIYCAYPSYYWEVHSTPNDSEYHSWVDDYWAMEMIDLPEAWDIETGDSGVLVGILDTGIDATHPDLQNRVNSTLSRCFSESYDNYYGGLIDTHGHGTQVAGIIGAQGDNTTGVAGVCWDVQLVSLKVNYNRSNAVIDPVAVEDAIYHAIYNDIKILNMSAGVGHDWGVAAAIVAYDGLLICSAGNDARDIDGGTANTYYPSSYEYDNIISVGACDKNDWRKSNSNYGLGSVDLFAPGTQILTTYPISLCNNSCGDNHNVPFMNGEGLHYAGYHYFENTSAATPFVTGVAALILSQNPNMDADTIKSRILDNVDESYRYYGDCITSGRLNAYKALTNS